VQGSNIATPSIIVEAYNTTPQKTVEHREQQQLGNWDCAHLLADGSILLIKPVEKWLRILIDIHNLRQNSIRGATQGKQALVIHLQRNKSLYPQVISKSNRTRIGHFDEF
jgi:hypothetical protein